MGTRFLMTAKSPVPRSTLAKYQEVQDAARIRASTAVDGMTQRMIDNPYLEKLEGGSGLRRLFVALASAWRWKQRTGMSVLHMLRTFIAAMRSGDSITQTLSAANAPVLIQRAMVEGHPDEGVLPSGQVASVLDDLPPVVELIDHIMAEATARIDAMPRPQGATAATNKQGDAA